MKSGAAVLVLGGGVALLLVAARNRERELAPGVTQTDINNSIQKTLDDIAAAKKKAAEGK